MRMIALALALAGAALAQESFSDTRDGKTYRAVKIGAQTWMAENLNYAEKGSVCYKNKRENCDKYGRLYDLNSAMKACPKGWHLPKKEEWETMTKYIGGENEDKNLKGCWNDHGKRLKAKSGWNDNGNGIDKHGFAALPGGGGNPPDYFYSIGYGGYWWSASKSNVTNVYPKSNVTNAYRLMIDHGFNYACWDDYYEASLFSVRCVRD